VLDADEFAGQQRLPHKLWKIPWQGFHLSRAALSLVFSWDDVLPRFLLDKSHLCLIMGSACS